MRAWPSMLWLLTLAVAVPARVAAQQPPAFAELPATLRGTEIDQALKAHAWPRAEQLLVAAIQQTPASPELLAVLGSVFLIERKPLNAAIAIKKAEALGPLTDDTRFTLALAYISLHHGDWARPELARLAEAESFNMTYQYWLGRLDYDAGQYKAAVDRFEHVVATEPGFVRAYDNLGLCYEALNDPDRALPQYRKAVELNRAAKVKSPWPAINFGTLLRNRGELKEAEATLREAVSEEDGLAQAHYQLGLVLEQEERSGDAVAQLKRAADRDPAYAEPYYALARIYRRQGHADAAAQAIATFERLHDASRAGAAK
jgi:tetratricopeptide (TPR) repeat protein